MRVTERSERPDEPAGREWPPIPLFVAIASLIGAEIWVIALTPAHPTLTINAPKNRTDVLVWTALFTCAKRVTCSR